MRENELTELAASLLEARDDLIEGLIRVREKHRITQKEVAERMAVSQPQISEFEHYDSNPTINSIIRYAIAVRASIKVQVESSTPKPIATIRDRWKVDLSSEQPKAETYNIKFACSN